MPDEAAIFSAHSNVSQNVAREVEQAARHSVVIIPFRVEDIQPTAAMDYFLSATHWLDTHDPLLEAHLQKLLRTVQTL